MIKGGYYIPSIEELRYGQTIEYNLGDSFWRDGSLIKTFSVENWKEAVYDKDFCDRNYVEYWMTSGLIDNERIIRVKI